MPDLAAPDIIELSLADSQPRQLRYMGPGNHGWIYREQDRSALYRLLSVRGRSTDSRVLRKRSDDAPIERRHAIVNWTDAATSIEGRPAWFSQAAQNYLVTPRDAGVQELSTLGSTFVVRYDTVFEKSLLEVLSDADPVVRLTHMVQVLLSMNHWMACLGPDVVPLPADIVFDQNLQARLLVLPQWRLPDADAVIAAPQRALYLAPEYVRGMDPKAMGYNANRYAIGAMLMQCLCEAPQFKPSDLLLDAAKGVLWSQGLPSLLAYWQQQSSGIKQAWAIARQLTDPLPQIRSAVSIEDLGHKLKQWLDQIRPHKALNELVNQGDWEAADRLLQDVLMVEESYEVLCLSAQIATQCGRPLEAMQYCERAIEQQPQREPAYLQQFQILVAEKTRKALHQLIKNRPDLGSRIDTQVGRNFRMLPPSWRTDDRIGSLAGHMVWRGQYQLAADFLGRALATPLVMGEDEELSALRLALRIQHIRALGHAETGVPRLAARKAIADLRQEIRSLYDQGALTSQTVQKLGDLCREMDEMINALETQPG